MKREAAPLVLAALILIGSLLATAPSEPTSAMFHDIHISFGRAELAASSFTAKLTLYKDDFFRALNNWHTGGYAGMNPEEFRALEMRYVTSYFRVFDGATPVALSAYKRTAEDASVTFELQYALSNSPAVLTLDDRILFREYNDQTNVLALKGYGQEVSHVFTKGSPTFYFHR